MGHLTTLSPMWRRHRLHIDYRAEKNNKKCVNYNSCTSSLHLLKESFTYSHFISFYYTVGAVVATDVVSFNQVKTRCCFFGFFSF